MDLNEAEYFELLKEEIVKTLKETYPATPSSMTDWMGTEIAYFQDDLLFKQNDSISDKWFYTHMKSKNEKLPRIDVLNLLSKYVGYIDWADFKYKISRIEKQKNSTNDTESLSDQSNKVFVLVPLLVIIISFIFIYILSLFGIDIMKHF